VRTIASVLFDIDGTLVDSNDAHAHAWVLAFQEHGRDVSFDAVRRAIGMGGDKLLPAVAAIDASSDLGKAVAKARARIFKERFLSTLQALPAARETLVRAADAGLTIGVATSAEPDEANALLEIAGVSDLVAAASDAKDVDRSKPDPDVVRAALEKIHARASEALLVGDTPYDVAAGRRAGLSVIAVRTGGWSVHDLAGARAIYADLRELLRAWNESPLRSSVAFVHHRDKAP
jgi:HAD superfamily hydrolase (TIGR01509 family)